MGKPGITVAMSDKRTTTNKVEVEITSENLNEYKVVVEIVETPTMPPARYAVVEFHSPDEGVVILRKVFLGAAGEK